MDIRSSSGTSAIDRLPRGLQSNHSLEVCSVFENHRSIVDGPLAVRSFPEGEGTVVVLIGELDRSNVASAELIIDDVLGGGAPVVVDLQELEFLDSSGIALLTRLNQAPGDRGRVRIVPSRSLGVTRIMAATGLDAMLAIADAPERRALAS
jgi:anti-anti-sigma factor